MPIQFLILQHPKESKNPLGTARLAAEKVPHTHVKVGLSWRSLSQALGKPAEAPKWGVLYVGTSKHLKSNAKNGNPFLVFDPKGRLQSDIPLTGIVLLDGNWKQSKTLWWRNPWLTKLNRVLLNPPTRSSYGLYRRQPRKNCLSTFESVLFSLKHLGAAEAELAPLESAYKDLLSDVAKATPLATPPLL